MKIYETKRININLELDEERDDFYSIDEYSRNRDIELTRTFRAKLEGIYEGWEITKIDYEYFDSFFITLRKEIKVD